MHARYSYQLRAAETGPGNCPFGGGFWGPGSTFRAVGTHRTSSPSTPEGTCLLAVRQLPWCCGVGVFGQPRGLSISCGFPPYRLRQSDPYNH